MADRSDIDAALSELRAAIDDYVAEVEGPVIHPPPPPPQPTEPYARFTTFPPFQAQDAMLHVETNVDDLEFVLFAENAQHTWYENTRAALPESGAFHMGARNTGDRVKVFSKDFTINVDSLPFLFIEEEPDEPPIVTPPTGNASRDKVNAFFNGIAGGLNVEREMVSQLDQGAHNYLRQQVPAEIARVFFAWRPQGGFAMNEGQSWQVASDNAVSQFVEGMKRMKQAGYKRLVADCADVCGEEDLNDAGAKLVAATAAKIAKAANAAGLGADFLCIGPVNEYAVSQDTVHRVQDVLLGAIRRELPQHVLSYGCDYWKYWGKLIEGTGYKPPKDELSVCDAHSYTQMDRAGWLWLAGEFAKWQQRTGRRLIYGEAGLGALQRDEQNYNIYPANARLMLPIMRPYVPMPWSVNNGGHWKLNWNGAELVNKQPYNNGGHAPDIGDALNEGLGLR